MRRTFTIQNKLGLHARAAAQLVKLAEQFTSEVRIGKDDQVVNGKSIMGLMMLAASEGSTIEVEAIGDDAEQMLDAIGELIAKKFHEEH
ncbi:MAG TPA: HPr family phosphocarrier protein [Candidatus Binatia bacterium]